jgi:cell division septum initiation protein DivIVA
MQPEDLTISGLPRSTLPGGIKPDAVADLLRRAAWDYREALAQATRLAETVGEQGRRIEELEAQVASPEANVTALKAPDEVARTLLASAHRIVRERREEARRESELVLKKAERRAEKIEVDARRRVEGGLSELEQLEAFRSEVSARLRSTLEAIVALGGDGAGSRAV